jgi:hypothetical protein
MRHLSHRRHGQAGSEVHTASYQWLPGALIQGVKWPGHEADPSPPFNAEVKNVWSYTSTPPIRLHGVALS